MDGGGIAEGAVSGAKGKAGKPAMRAMRANRTNCRPSPDGVPQNREEIKVLFMIGQLRIPFLV
ncbi:MAG: hypothetical protein RIS76_882, partial [Verrucomicrobiota bacterium]